MTHAMIGALEINLKRTPPVPSLGHYYSPHYESYMWAVFLWAYSQSGYEPLLQRAQAALTDMMVRMRARS